jgi:type I site-specific restriction-modification system R (restriction) subunit
MEMNVVASGGLSPLAQRQGSPAAQAPQRAMSSPSASSDSRMVRDLGAVLDELGLSPQGEDGGGSSASIRDSMEAFINTMMGALQQQQEQQLALQQQQRQEQEQRKLALEASSENPLKRDLERLLEQLDQPGEQGKARAPGSENGQVTENGQVAENEQVAENKDLNPLQSQLTKLLESSGAAESGVTLKEVLSGLASKLPNEPAERKGYRVDTQV